METFDHSVSLGMVSGGHYPLNPPKFGKLSADCGGELCASVGGYGGGNSVVLNPTMCKRVNNRLGCHVDQRDGDRPPRKAVNGR